MRTVIFSSLFTFVLLLSNVAWSTGFSQEERWLKLSEMASRLDLSGTELTMSSGGTSVYAIVKQNGHAIGAVIPANSATQLSGEVLSFTVARALGFSNLYQGGVYFPLRGANLAAFRALIPDSPFKSAAKEENRLSILNRIAKSPAGIDAIFKKWESRPADYDALVRGNSLNSSHVLKGSHQPLTSFLKCQGPQPQKDVIVSLNGGSTNEYEAARQMSSILLIDALMQQWDRFSGGNLQTVTENGRVYFAAFDNGGTWSEPWTAKHLNLVSRFDRNVAARVLELNRFLNQGGNSFLGFRTEQDLIKALGAENFSADFRRFKRSLNVVAGHIQKNSGCFFE